MSTMKLLCAELWHRKMNVALSFLALIAAATLFVASPTLLSGYQRESQQQLKSMEEETAAALLAMQQETDAQLVRMEQKAQVDLANLENRTKRIMRDLGFNLRIVHRNTDMTQLYANFVSFDMPEEYLQRLANHTGIDKIVHLVATLRQMIQWNGQSRLIIGFAPEATQSHIEQKSPMGFQIEPGTVFLGSVAGEGYSVGDEIDIRDKKFQVARILEPHGRADEDIAICMDLKDAQELLGKPGKISEILALGCKCETLDRIEEVTAQLELALPDAKVTEYRLQAIAREEQRELVSAHHAQTIQDYKDKRQAITHQEQERRQEILEQERQHRDDVLSLLSGVTSVVTPLVVLVCALWVGLLSWSNVRERRTEIGLLRALGKGSASIAGLFLGKAVLLGLLAGLMGCGLGYGLAQWLALDVFRVSPQSFAPSTVAWLSTILGTPLVAAMASYLPTLSAINQDPAVVLLES